MNFEKIIKAFMLSIHGLVVRISKQLPSSPEQIRINKQFWTELNIHTRSV